MLWFQPYESNIRMAKIAAGCVSKSNQPHTICRSQRVPQITLNRRSRIVASGHNIRVPSAAVD
jgi:hypothetical protein